MRGEFSDDVSGAAVDPIFTGPETSSGSWSRTSCKDPKTKNKNTERFSFLMLRGGLTEIRTQSQVRLQIFARGKYALGVVLWTWWVPCYFQKRLPRNYVVILSDVLQPERTPCSLPVKETLMGYITVRQKHECKFRRNQRKPKLNVWKWILWKETTFYAEQLRNYGIVFLPAPWTGIANPNHQAVSCTPSDGQANLGGPVHWTVRDLFIGRHRTCKTATSRTATSGDISGSYQERRCL